MNATTVTRPVETDQLSISTTSPSPSPTNPTGSTRSSRTRRTAAGVGVLAILSGAAIVIGQATTSHHVNSTPVTPQLSVANRALIAGDTAVVQQFSQPNTVSCRVGQPC